MSSMDEDKELVARTIKGEKEAFEMIIQKYQQPLLNYIGRTVGERELALDFTQEVFIRTYSSIHSYKRERKKLMPSPLTSRSETKTCLLSKSQIKNLPS
jgi:RNA polymerase sigma-70 factor (ECF subfamily)